MSKTQSSFLPIENPLVGCARDNHAGPPEGAGTVWHRLSGWSRGVHVLAVAAGAVALLHATPADACSGTHAHDVPAAYPTVPANGGPMVVYRCQVGTSDCAWNEPLAVFLDDVEVPGRFVHHDQDYTFVPDEPLEVGAVYSVPGFGDVRAVEAVPVDLGAIEIDVYLGATTTVASAETACCADRDSCGHSSCWYTEPTHVTYEVGPLVQLDQRNLETARSEVRFSWTDSSGHSGETAWAAEQWVMTDLAEAAEEYCVVVEVRSLIDGETHAFDEVCFEHGDQPVPGETEEVATIEDADLSQCSMPVEGYLEDWCRDSHAVCLADETADFICERVAEHCTGVDLGDEGSGGQAGASNGPDAGDDDVDGEGGLCTVTTPGSRATSLWGFASLGLVLLMSRRRLTHATIRTGSYIPPRNR